MFGGDSDTGLDAVLPSILAQAYDDFVAAASAPSAKLFRRAQHGARGLQFDAGYDAIGRKYQGLADFLALGTRISFVGFRLAPAAIKRMRREMQLADVSESRLSAAIKVAAATTPMTLDDYDHAAFLDLVDAVLSADSGID